MKVTFHGAAGEVTGSNFLIEHQQESYVVDCGLYQGQGAFEENKQPFMFDASKVTATVVTHAHLDHVGRLPMLVRAGFRGPIFATEATCDLIALVLEDAYGVMRSRARHNESRILYEEHDYRRAIGLCQSVAYGQDVKIGPSATACFYDAGHILGSASIELEIGGKTLVFSGDLGHWPNLLLHKFDSPKEADLVVMEATYGGVEHPDSPHPNQDRALAIKEAVEWAVQRRGVLLIPAFSIERTEEILFIFNHLFNTKQLPRVPIFLDSPLAIDTLGVYERHMSLYNRDVQTVAKTDRDIFDFQGLVLTPTTEDSRDINDLAPPKVIIAGSGMMEGGRIVHHLARYLDDPETLLLIIGFQAGGTLGAAIAGGAEQVMINGRSVNVRATIKRVDVFSGHADNSDLLEWVKAIKQTANSQIAIVHSSPERAQLFKEELTKIFPERKIIIAEPDQSIEI